MRLITLFLPGGGCRAFWPTRVTEGERPWRCLLIRVPSGLIRQISTARRLILSHPILIWRGERVAGTGQPQMKMEAGVSVSLGVSGRVPVVAIPAVRHNPPDAAEMGFLPFSLSQGSRWCQV